MSPSQAPKSFGQESVGPRLQAPGCRHQPSECFSGPKIGRSGICRPQTVRAQKPVGTFCMCRRCGPFNVCYLDLQHFIVIQLEAFHFKVPYNCFFNASYTCQRKSLYDSSEWRVALTRYVVPGCVDGVSRILWESSSAIGVSIARYFVDVWLETWALRTFLKRFSCKMCFTGLFSDVFCFVEIHIFPSSIVFMCETILMCYQTDHVESTQ